MFSRLFSVFHIDTLVWRCDEKKEMARWSECFVTWNFVKTESKLESLEITRGFSQAPIASELQAGAIIARRLLAVTVSHLGGSCQKSDVPDVF